MPRINKGRAARRRKVKARSINEAAQALLNGKGLSISSNSAETSDFLGLGTPQDREHSLPGALARRREESQRYERERKEKLGEISANGWYVRDEEMLMAQLGFIPGNGISVSGRVQDLKSQYPNLFQLLQSQSIVRNEFKNKGVEKKSSLICSLDSPTVLKLYPLAIRDVFVGGKAGGRKFKSRKRGRYEISNDKVEKECAKEGDIACIGREQYSNKIRKTAHGEQPTERKDPENNISNLDEGIIGCKSSDSDNKTIEPFPTTFWLTHPALRTLVSQLEIGSTHNVPEMEKKLSLSTEDSNAMKNAHLAYAEIRKNLVTPSDVDFIEKRKWEESIGSERGVAGIRKHETVKCLDAHTAHCLATFGTDAGNKDENIVGKWTVQAIENMIEKSKDSN